MMLSSNGTINYDIGAHTRDAQETSAARQESTTRNLHGSITKNLHIPGFDFFESRNTSWIKLYSTAYKRLEYTSYTQHEATPRLVTVTAQRPSEHVLTNKLYNL